MGFFLDKATCVKYNNGMKNEWTKQNETKSKVIAELPAACISEAAAVEFLEKQRWGDSPCCPHEHCGSFNVVQLQKDKTQERKKRFHWYCRD